MCFRELSVLLCFCDISVELLGIGIVVDVESGLAVFGVACRVQTSLVVGWLGIG